MSSADFAPSIVQVSNDSGLSGQVLTQTGSYAFSNRSAQNVHFSTTPGLCFVKPTSSYGVSLS